MSSRDCLLSLFCGESPEEAQWTWCRLLVRRRYNVSKRCYWGLLVVDVRLTWKSMLAAMSQIDRAIMANGWMKG